MSQNGPYPGQQWPGKSPEEPYSEPSDPWSGQEPSSSWSPPQQPHAAPAAAWSQPAQPEPRPQAQPTPQPRRGFALGAVVAVLSLLIGGGIAAGAWFFLTRDDQAVTPSAVPTTAAANGGARPQSSEDARFATKGQCLRNEGSNLEPELRVVVCAANTFQVLKRIDGRTTGEKDAVSKCAKVSGYTKWYYYDTEYDDVDFVLCLKEYGPV